MKIFAQKYIFNLPFDKKCVFESAIDLLDELMETVIPNLERFPDMGRSFLARQAGSVEVLNGLESQWESGV